MEVLKWLRKQGCPWDEETCAFAADGGHLELLKWARNKGCPWDMETCANAYDNGHSEVLEWAREHGCPCFSDDESEDEEEFSEDEIF